MADAASWAGAFLAGVVLGCVFFGGLWWTVRLGAASVAPAWWLVARLALRIALVLAGFYAFGAGQPARMGLCLLGFLLARVIVLRSTRQPPSLEEPPCA
jgi:F1F0 ATPase subunit 2